MVFFWLVAAILLLVAEANTLAFYAVFLSIGAFVAAGTAAFDDPLWVQGVVFAAISMGGTVVVRPMIKKRVLNRDVPVASFPGVQGLVGQACVTADDVGDESHPGHVLLAGERWLAITHGAPLSAATKVVVREVLGTTLVVQ